MNHIAAKYNFSCRVCGDEAIGFHFGGFSCESCKAFFRRNAFKQMEFSCTGEYVRKHDGNCQLDKITRKYCSFCRLSKSLTIGMKTDLIKVTGSKSNQVCKFEASVNYCLTGTLCSIDFQASEFEHFNEIYHAMSTFCDESKLSIAGAVSDRARGFNLISAYIRNVITFCKKLSAFKCMKHEDQLTLLKPAFSPLNTIRIAFMYDRQIDAFPVVENQNNSSAVYIKMNLLDGLKVENLASQLREYNTSLQDKMENDVNIRNLISGLVLFKRTDANLSCHEFVRYQYFIYNRLLQRYLQYKCRNKAKAEEQYCSILVLIQMLDFIDLLVQKIYSHINFDKRDVIMEEIFVS